MIQNLVASYGYLVVFIAVTLECLGIPVPGETTLIAAGVYAGTTHKIAIVPIVVIAAIAAIIGDNLGYLLGRTGGHGLVLRVGRYFGVDAQKLQRSRSLFARHGRKIVFLGRFVSVLRTYAALLAGVSRMPWERFAMSNALGGVLWAAIFGIGAYEFGGLMSKLGEVVTLTLGAVAIVAAVGSYFAVRRYRAKIRGEVVDV